jgi:hypothetical protein
MRKSPTASPAPERPGSAPARGSVSGAAAAGGSRQAGIAQEVASTTAAGRKSPAQATAPCPRCGAALVNPGSLGWCQKCGYSQSLEEEAPVTSRMNQRRAPSRLGMLELWDLIRETPRWLRILLAGVVVIAVLSLIPNHFLDEDCLERAIYTTVQIGVGLLMCIGATIWACVWIGIATEKEISPKDFILPFQMWSVAFGYLPRSRKPVTCLAWGVAVQVCAVLLIGGLDFWWEVYNPKRFAPPPSRSMDGVTPEGQEDKEWDPKLKDLKERAEKEKKEEKKESKIDRRPTVPCVIIGYQVDNNQLTGLVLARARGERLIYAGVVRRGFEKAAASLVKQLEGLRQEEPYLPGLEISAVWVNPEVVCAVHQSGTDAAGLLASPNFKELVKAK